MSEDLKVQESNRSNGKATKPKRELSWQVANNLLISFQYAWAGLTYAFQTQRNFRIHVTVGTVAIGLSLFLGLPWVEITVIGLTIGAVLALELLNTAIESVVDLTVKQTYHELAKIAKDCSAGAVLVSALVAVFVAGSLLLPPLIERIQTVLTNL
ncbi:MAG: diacylglycerol kinase family protein [Leptolyngbyaceae cyanobacterium bins.59]|nr:diacylglycerol kinase family protein [Leptolyngbyaceae cyanobacterium bins.59]